MDKTMTNDMQGEQDNGQNTTEQTPLDGIISRVKEYVKNPKLATTETLESLLADLVDLKSVVDDEETHEEHSGGDTQDKRPSLTIMLGMGNKKMGGMGK